MKTPLPSEPAPASRTISATSSGGARPDPTIDAARRLFIRARLRPPAGREQWVRLRAPSETCAALVLALLAHDSPPATATTEDDRLLGQSLGGWRLDEVIGIGSSGRVYAATRVPERGEVEADRGAFKLLGIRHSGTRTTGPSRAETERSALARLNHPAIVRLLDSDTVELDGRPRDFVVTELVEDAEPLLDGALREQLNLPGRIALLIEIAEAVGHAHRAGVMHRDLKPANVVLDPHGRPHVLDFGLARTADSDRPNPTIAGSRSSLAPEQIDPRFGSISARTDVYALGVLGYRLLLGEAPYEVGASLASAAQAVLHVPAIDPGAVDPDVPEPVARALLRAVSKQPERRFADAGEFARALRLDSRGAPGRKRLLGIVAGTLALATGIAYVASTLAFEHEVHPDSRSDSSGAHGREFGSSANPEDEKTTPTKGEEPVLNPRLLALGMQGLMATGVLADTANASTEIQPVFASAPGGDGIESADLEGDLAVFGDRTYPGGGGARVCRRIGNDWVMDPVVLVPPDGPRTWLGRSVKVTPDWVFVGDPPDFFGPGTVHAWSRSGGVLTYRQSITPSVNNTGNAFGWAIAFDGGNLFITSRFEASLRGAVYRFTLDANGQWVERQKLVGSGTGAGAEFGWQLDAADGVLLASAWLSECGYSSPSGTLHVFRANADGNYSEEQSVSDGTPGCSGFGFSTRLWQGLLITGGDLQPSSLKLYSRDGDAWTSNGVIPGPSAVFARAGDRLIGNLSGTTVVIEGSPTAPILSRTLAAPLGSSGTHIKSAGDARYVAMAMVNTCAIYDLTPDCDGNGTLDSDDIAKGAPDCDGDGTLDACQIAASPKLDTNEDGRLDSCSMRYGDFDLNGFVDAFDLSALLATWGVTGSPVADLDGSGEVTASDLAILLGRWGPVEL